MKARDVGRLAGCDVFCGALYAACLRGMLACAFRGGGYSWAWHDGAMAAVLFLAVPALCLWLNVRNGRRSGLSGALSWFRYLFLGLGFFAAGMLLGRWLLGMVLAA